MGIAVEGDRDKSRAANKVKLYLHDLRMSGCLPQDYGVVEFFYCCDPTLLREKYSNDKLCTKLEAINQTSICNGWLY